MIFRTWLGGIKKSNDGTDLHKQFNGLGECGDALLWFLNGPDVLHSRLSIPRPFLDLAYSRQGKRSILRSSELGDDNAREVD